MEKNGNMYLPEEESSESTLNLRDIIDQYLRHWKWFVLVSVISILLAYLNLNFQSKTYQADATIKIKDDKRNDKSTLSAFQDLGVLTNSSKKNIEDEIEILKSKSLIEETIKSLKFNIQFFTKKNSISEFFDDKLGMDTEFYEVENYKEPPLSINLFISDSVLHKTNAQFYILINSLNNYTYIDTEAETTKKYAFGEKISTTFGDIIITPNVDFKEKNLIGERVKVVISSVKNIVNSYAERLEIRPKTEFSSVLTLSISDGVKEKAENFIDQLVNLFNQRAIRLKKELTASTSSFVDERLEEISKELSIVDLTAESLKTRFRVSDAASETGLNMESGRIIENQIIQASTELKKIEYIKDLVSEKSSNDLIPADVGISDNGVSSSVMKYNELMMQKKRLLENSTEKNPIVVNINDQLATINQNITQGLTSLESSQKMSLNALTEQGQRINSKLYSAPKQERQIRDVKRQQLIKEELFLYLLKKREETAITLGVADPNAIILDPAESLPDAIGPKKGSAYIAALLFGIIIPFAFIYIKDLIDTKIHSREDVERVLNIPIIGDIPKYSSKDRFLIKKEDYSSIAEAFRILRTNLNFILPNNESKNDTGGKVVFVTSTIAHEGKSLVATNLAAALAHANKRTLILGLDIRAPSIKPYLGIRGKIGVTNYVIDNNLSVEDLIIKIPNIDNLHLISSGDIAPNPAELLMSQRVSSLFSYARNNYDNIIVDTAAFSMVTDTMLLSNFADAFIYVIRANFLDKRMLKYIKSLHNEKRMPNMALLINDLDYKKAFGYGYGYGYGDAFDKSKKKKLFGLMGRK